MRAIADCKIDRRVQWQRLTFKDGIAEAKKPATYAIRHGFLFVSLFVHPSFFFLPSPPLHIIRVLLFSPFFFPSDVNSSLLLLLLLRVEVTLPARNATENVNVNFAAPLLFPSPTFVSTSSPVEHSDPTAIISTPSHRGKTKYSRTRPDRCRAIAAFYRQFLRRSVRFCEYPRSKREEKRGGGGGRNTEQLNAARFQKGGKKRKERGEKLKEGIEGRRKNRTRRKRGQGGVHQSVFRSVGRWFAFSVRETRLCYACSMHALSRGDAESATAAPRHAVYTRTRLSGVEGGGGRLGAMLICMRRHDGRRRSSGGCATLGAEGSEGKHRSLSPVHPLLAPSSRPSATRAPRRHASSARFTFPLSLFPRPPPPPPPPPCLRDFPRFLLSIRHGVIFPSCSRVRVAAFFSFPSTTNATSENNEPSSRISLSFFFSHLVRFRSSRSLVRQSDPLVRSIRSDEGWGKKSDFRGNYGDNAREITREMRVYSPLCGREGERAEGVGGRSGGRWHCLFSLGHIA